MLVNEAFPRRACYCAVDQTQAAQVSLRKISKRGERYIQAMPGHRASGWRQVDRHRRIVVVLWDAESKAEAVAQKEGVAWHFAPSVATINP
jgi:hypothetical protein